MAAPRILVIRLSALGDVLFTLPAVHALRERRPDLEIDWVVEERAATLLDLYPGLRRVIVFRRGELTRGLRRPSSWGTSVAELVRHVRALRREAYDAVLDFQGNLKSGVHAWLAHGTRKIGFARPWSREGNRHFQHESVRPVADCIHRIDQGLALARALEPDLPEATAPPLVVPAASAAFAAQGLAQVGIGERPFVVLHPGTSAFGAIKRWAPDRFAHAGDLLAARLGLRVLVTWGPGEQELAATVARQMKEPAGHLAPPTGSLADLAALLQRARLVIGSDSAPLHLAAFLGTPVVALFGPKDPRIYGPRFSPQRVVHTWLPCSPCTRRTCPDVLCMEEIGVGQVFEAAQDLLRETAAAPRVVRGV